MPTVARWALAVLAIILGCAGFWYLTPRSPSFGMFAADEGLNIWRFVLSFSATIAGVALGSAYRQLRALQVSGQRLIEEPRVFVKEMFRSVDMWLGLAGAPIVYALLLQSTGGMTLAGLLVIALENGFCCLVIVNSFVSGHAGERRAGRLERGSRGANV